MNKNIIVSQEAYKDQFKIDVEKAFELCNSMENIYTMYQNNLNTKLYMLNKINSVYGKASRGIENYCRIQSLEADESNTTSNDAIPGASQDVANGTNSSNNTQQNTEKNSKTAQLLQKVHETIANLLTKLFQWITDLINKFKYNNKVFENTINSINNATEEELNKISDDLKNVEFDGKNLILLSKHPQQNLQKFMGSYQLLSETFGNAIQAATNNPKDYTKARDFSAKLKEFVKSVPDVGNTCPTLEGEGIDTLKQYTDALKSFNNQGLNYNEKQKSFNSYYGGTETFSDKVTVGKITGNIDAKSVVNIIKTESEEISKFSESLKTLNETNKKNGKGISDILKKLTIGTGGDNDFVNNIQAQCNLLTVCEKTLAQINSIFCGICSNSIRTINTVKGKLIDFTKKNVNNNKKNENKKEETTNTEETKESLFIDYQFDNFMKSLENMQDLQFTEIYSVEDTIEVSSNIRKRNPIVFIKELFKKIWKSLVNYVNNIIQKISEYWGSKRLDFTYKHNKDVNREEILRFAKDAQILLRRMNKSVNRINEINDDLQYTWVKQSKEKDQYIIAFFSQSVAIMKIFVMLEKIVYKAFGKFRNSVIKGNIKKVGNGSIEKFANFFDMTTNKYSAWYKKFINRAYNDDMTLSETEVFINDFKNICIDVDKIIKEYTGSSIKIEITASSGKIANTNLNFALDELEQKLNEPAILDNIGKKLFGIISTEEIVA